MSENHERGDLNQRFADAVAALCEATEQHAQAKARARAAEHDEASARSQLNDAQKRMDALVAEMRKDAPPGSDWHEQQRQGTIRVPLVVRAGEE